MGHRARLNRPGLEGLEMATKAKVRTLRAKLDKAVDAVYAAAPSGQTPFNGCLAAASEAVRSAYHAARAALDTAELEAIGKGKAYRGAFGMLAWYR